MADKLHPWEDVGNDLADYMLKTPDLLAEDLIGDRRPWQPKMTHDEMMDWHLEHLYPPQLHGQLDQDYLGKMMASATDGEIRALGPALQRFVTNKAHADGMPPPGEGSDRQYGGALADPPSPVVE
jgi:hypothetical protein